MIKDLVASCRSYRRFHEEERIPYEELKEWWILPGLQAAQPIPRH